MLTVKYFLNNQHPKYFGQCCMLISHVKSIYSINLHHSALIEREREREHPLKSLDPRFLREGKGLEIASLNNCGRYGFAKHIGFCE